METQRHNEYTLNKNEQLLINIFRVLPITFQKILLLTARGLSREVVENNLKKENVIPIGHGKK